MALIPLGAFAMFVMIADLLRRLIADAILNGTIRKALDVDPSVAPLLIAKLDARARWPVGATGWLLVVAGVAFAASALLGGTEDATDAFQAAAVSVIIGGGLLGYAWWVKRRAPAE